MSLINKRADPNLVNAIGLVHNSVQVVLVCVHSTTNGILKASFSVCKLLLFGISKFFQRVHDIVSKHATWLNFGNFVYSTVTKTKLNSEVGRLPTSLKY